MSGPIDPARLVRTGYPGPSNLGVNGNAPRIGVLALQGAFREHAAVLGRLGADVVEVRLPEELDGLDGLVIPGGESTTIMRLARIYGLDEAIRRFHGAIFGTCAGMIVLDREHLDTFSECPDARCADEHAV